MPPPPPPPPGVGPPRPPLSTMKMPKVSTGGADRNALLSSIQKGACLKKTVTNDRSAPIVNNKIKSNGAPSTGVSMANGGVPQLGGLFAGGMPKLRPTGRSFSSTLSNGNKPPPPALPPARKPTTGLQMPQKPLPTGGLQMPQKPSPPISRQNSNSTPEALSLPQCNNGAVPSSPKPSLKSNPAPPPPPSSRKPNHDQLRARNSLTEQTNVHNKPPPPSPPDINGNQSERNPPLPAKPTGLIRLGSRGAPPRPPSDTKPLPPQKSAYLKQNGESRRPSIDRSKSMRETLHSAPLSSLRVGTSAESPAAPYRTLNSHARPAPPIPKTVGRVAGSAMLSNLKPPSERPPKPPTRPTVMAPPPPSQPPPPPPPHRTVADASKSNGLGSPSSPATAWIQANLFAPVEPIKSSQQSAPPLPPERVESSRLSNRSSGEFENRYGHMFKSRHVLPIPLKYTNMQKSYPSKNNVKRQRRAPQPPTQHDQTSRTPHHTPPPPPPHAPIHLQVGRKMYGTEASHC